MDLELVHVKYKRANNTISEFVMVYLGNSGEKMIGLRSDRLCSKSIGLIKNSINKISNVEPGNLISWFQDHLDDFGSAFVTLNPDQVDIFARYKINGN